jgi:F-type H+-transporting ATPase subunit c
MKKLFFVLTILLLVAMPAMAQTGGGGGGSTFTSWTFAGVGLGIAVAGAAVGQGRVASAVAESLARNPSARAGIQLALFIGLAFIESLVLFIWVIIFLRAGGVV